MVASLCGVDVWRHRHRANIAAALILCRAAAQRALLRNVMTLSDAALREIAEVCRKHVDQETLEKIVDDLLDIRGDKSFRDIIGTLARELKARF